MLEDEEDNEDEYGTGQSQDRYVIDISKWIKFDLSLKIVILAIQVGTMLLQLFVIAKLARIIP